MMKNKLQILVDKIGFPVLIRPSYVIGGKGMERINNGADLAHYLENK